MFTGIIEELGTVSRFERHQTGARMRVQCKRVLQESEQGSSIAVNGVCLTAVDLDENSFAADLAPETLARTSLTRLKPGEAVNLERPLRLVDRLSGHIVQGHVDGTAELLSLERLGNDNWWLRLKVPSELDRYVAYKGSVAVDGVSLTVASIQDQVLSITIIPHTYAMTSLRQRVPGDPLNLECDILAKYLEKLTKST